MDREYAGASARFGLTLLALFVLAAAALGIAPRYRQDWLLENVVVAIALPLLVLGWRRLRFSRGAYLALFVFLLLHEVGAHYTYSEVPYDDAFAWLTGHSLNALLGLHRNHFDRAVHFLYGLLVTPMAVELFAQRAPPRGLWRWVLPVCFVMSHSVIYELVEWLAALRFGGELGTAYLGTQGDPWDAQQDMALAAFGSALSMLFLRSLSGLGGRVENSAVRGPMFDASPAHGGSMRQEATDIGTAPADMQTGRPKSDRLLACHGHRRPLD